MTINSYSALDKGRKRKYNEDNLLVYEPKDRNIHSRKGYLYIVADGVGGLTKGDIASKTAVETIREAYYSSKSSNIKKSLINAVKKANSKIFSLSNDEEKMGTTVVCLVVKGNQVYIANVGDSRAYVFRENKLIKLTEDHSFVGERVRMGELTEEQARVHPRSNIILRCMGTKNTIEVDIFVHNIREGDRFLLCSDGLWGELPYKKLNELMKNDSSKAMNILVDNANQAGGSDNISIVLVDIKELGMVTVEDKKIKVLSGVSYGLVAASLILIGLLGFFIYKFIFTTAPIAKIDVDIREGNIPFSVNLDASKSYDNKEIVSYKWYIEGVELEGITQSYRFEEPKDSAVSLVCEDSDGNKDEQTITINAYDEEIPVIELSLENEKDEYWIGYDDYLEFKINSSDNSNKIEKIILYENDMPIGEFKQSNILYKYSIDNDGENTLYAIAYDSSGNKVKSETIEVLIKKDNENPRIKCEALETLDDLNLSESNTYFITEIEVTDNKELDRVELYINGDRKNIINAGNFTRILGDFTIVETFTYLWNIEEDGINNIGIKAYDKNKNIAVFKKEVLVNIYPEQNIVYSSYFEGSNEIFLKNQDGKIKQLTDDRFSNINPTLSYSGDKICFCSRRDGSYDMYIMDIDGENVIRLTEVRSQSKLYPVFNADGSVVIFSHVENGSIIYYSVDIDTETVSKLK